MGVIALVVVFAIVAAGLLLFSRRAAAPTYGISLGGEPVADFTLPSSLGTPVSLSDFRGQHTLLYFGYTTCPDVCPTTLADLRNTRAALGRQSGRCAGLVFISRPGTRHAGTDGRVPWFFDPTFIGLAGSIEEMESIASRFGVFYAKSENSGATDYLIDHTSTVLVVDPDGNLQLMFPYGVTGEQMASDLRSMIR